MIADRNCLQTNYLRFNLALLGEEAKWPRIRDSASGVSDEKSRRRAPCPCGLHCVSRRRDSRSVAKRHQARSALNSGDSLPRVQVFDHIPALLSTFERGLRHAPAEGAASAQNAAQEPAAAHGLQRCSKAMTCVRSPASSASSTNAWWPNWTGIPPRTRKSRMPWFAAARRVWAALCSTGIEESVGQYFQLQQQEAAGHVRDLESALSDIQELESNAPTSGGSRT